MNNKIKQLAGLSLFAGVTFAAVGIAFAWGIGPGMMCYGSFWLMTAALAIAYTRSNRE